MFSWRIIKISVLFCWRSNLELCLLFFKSDFFTFIYEGCSKWIAYFYLETSNFKLAQSTHFMPSKYSPWLEMQSFSRCIHFLKVSRYADLGTVIRYWWMADPSACRDWYFRQARNAFNFGNKKKSHGARSGEYGGWGKTVTFSFFKNAVTIAEVWAGALSCRRRTCLKPVAGRSFW